MFLMRGAQKQSRIQPDLIIFDPVIRKWNTYNKETHTHKQTQGVALVRRLDRFIILFVIHFYHSFIIILLHYLYIILSLV